jgi:hypothetical protein
MAMTMDIVTQSCVFGAGKILSDCLTQTCHLWTLKVEKTKGIHIKHSAKNAESN